jgi:hypothetical protein
MPESDVEAELKSLKEENVLLKSKIHDLRRDQEVVVNNEPSDDDVLINFKLELHAMVVKAICATIFGVFCYQMRNYFTK